MNLTLKNKRQAISKQQVAWQKKRRQKWLLRFSYFILGLSLVLWLVTFLRHQQIFDIKHVLISGQYQQTNPQKIRSAVQSILHHSLLEWEFSGLKHHLLSLPWIASVKLKRVWPNELKIDLIQKKPVARWFQRGLITQQGKIFFPSLSSFSHTLPQINAPKNLLHQALKDLLMFQLTLAHEHLYLAQLTLDQQANVTLQLGNGMHILLGKNNLFTRLKKFIAIYPKVFESRVNQVQYVDMRYTNGMAVKWRGSAEN